MKKKMESEAHNSESKNPFRKNRKKKKPFLANARGFAKQGIYGRGSQIDDDLYNYFINILDTMRNGFNDIEEKVNMANNVFEQTKEQEVHLASNQIVCKVMENLIGFTDPPQLETYFNTFAECFRPICSDRFASHVLQKMVGIAFLRSVSKDHIKTNNKIENQKEDEDNEDGQSLAKKAKLSIDPLSEENFNLEKEFTLEHKTNCRNFVLRMGKFMLNNLEDFVWDSCASHIIRTCILCLSGIYVVKKPFEKGGADMPKNRHIYEVPDEWHQVAKEFAERLEMWPQFIDFPYREQSSALLSILLTALKTIDKKMLKRLGRKILMESFLKIDEADKDKEQKMATLDDENEKSENISTIPKMPKVFEYQSSVILLETLLTIAGPKLLIQLYAMLFANKLALLAKTPLTNFAVQKLLCNVKEKEDFENIFNELEEHVEELLKIGHTGVITALSSACLRLQTKQAQLIVALQTALHIKDNKERLNTFFLCLLKLKPFEILQKDKSNFVHLHGALLIQDILRFNKPILMVNCILETPPEYLVSVFNNQSGSYICDAFLQSKFIGEKSRDKLLKHLEGFYIDLAIMRSGSRVIESCFQSAHDKRKERIAKELVEKRNMLKGSIFGKILNSKLYLETYRTSPDKWKVSLQKKESKAQKLFKDIMN